MSLGLIATATAIVRASSLGTTTTNLTTQPPRRGRKNSEVGSESSQMELGDHVVKTTEFRLEEESVEREGGMERDRVTRMSWDQKPMPKRGFQGGRVSGGG
ncbi:hypothetical protein VE02_04166 [Pseudogymnoascus sp. 03VT05]|nr:hypothetical protein VE02_04166 [Pseudogymnoascus sp. 03VT05]